MSKSKPHKVGVIRHESSHAASTQKKELEKWGVDQTFEFTKSEKNMRLLYTSLRKGWWVGVYTLDILVPRGANIRTRKSRLLREIVDELFDAEIVLYELKTGRSCKDRKDLVGMFDDAAKTLAGHRNQKAGPGRPTVHNYSERDLQILNGIWRDKGYSNPEQRIAAIREYENDKGEKPYAHLNVSTFYLHVKDKDKERNDG